MKKMKFIPGDLVEIRLDYSDNFDPCAGKEAIVEECSTEDNGNYQYVLEVNGCSKGAWFDEDELTLIRHDAWDLRETWKARDEKIWEERSDLNWIFSNGQEVMNKRNIASVTSLAKHLGILNMWGTRGEGMVMAWHVSCVLDIASPFLVSGDKAGYLEYCEKITSERVTRK